MNWIIFAAFTFLFVDQIASFDVQLVIPDTVEPVYAVIAGVTATKFDKELSTELFQIPEKYSSIKFGYVNDGQPIPKPTIVSDHPDIAKPSFPISTEYDDLEELVFYCKKEGTATITFTYSETTEKTDIGNTLTDVTSSYFWSYYWSTYTADAVVQPLANDTQLTTMAEFSFVKKCAGGPRSGFNVEIDGSLVVSNGQLQQMNYVEEFDQTEFIFTLDLEQGNQLIKADIQSTNQEFIEYTLYGSASHGSGGTVVSSGNSATLIVSYDRCPDAGEWDFVLIIDLASHGKLQFPYKKLCAQDSVEIPVVFVDVGTVQGGDDIVKAGETNKKWDSKGSAGSPSEEETTIFHIKVPSGSSVMFIKPTVSVKPYLFHPILSGDVASGGQATGFVTLKVGYNCLSTGVASVQLTLPIQSQRTVQIHWHKKCDLSQHSGNVQTGWSANALLFFVAVFGCIALGFYIYKRVQQNKDIIPTPQQQTPVDKQPILNQPEEQEH